MNLEAIMADEKLAKHAKGVMDTIGIAVGFLQDLPSLSPILNQLGASHAKFLLQDGHFKVIVLPFLQILDRNVLEMLPPNSHSASPLLS